MAFKFDLNDGTTYEFPHALETGKLKGAIRKFSRYENDPELTDDENAQKEMTLQFELVEYLLGVEGPDIEAYDKIDFTNEAKFMKKFMGGLDPKV